MAKTVTQGKTALPVLLLKSWLLWEIKKPCLPQFEEELTLST
jgi:hypothetical protein